MMNALLLGVTEADGFALSMLAILGVSFGFVALLLVAVFRNAGKQDPDDHELLRDDTPTDDDPAPARGSKDEPSQPWEKEADWWKS